MSQTSSPSYIVYSCSFANYDQTFGPLAKTPHTRFIRFGTTRSNWKGIWDHQSVADHLQMATQTLTNRYFKFFPSRVLPPCDIAIYVDGNILIRTDLSPLIKEFDRSGADIAFFPHPSNRTLGQEITFALQYRIPESDRNRAEKQRKKYGGLGLLDQLVTENSIIFYRMNSTKINALGEIWWAEMQEFTKRDQISLPYVLQDLEPTTLLWDWHFRDGTNPYFDRYSHRPKYLVDRLIRNAHFMKDHSLWYRTIFGGVRLAGRLRRALLITSSKSKTDKK